MQHHPDKTRSEDDSEFVLANKAYRYLMSTKAAYDKVLILCIGNEMIDLNDKVNVIDDIDDVDEIEEQDNTDGNEEKSYKYECKQCGATINI